MNWKNYYDGPQVGDRVTGWLDDDYDEPFEDEGEIVEVCDDGYYEVDFDCGISAVMGRDDIEVIE